MYKYPSKRNTLNNIKNIEDLSLYNKTPEDIMEAVEDDMLFEELLTDIIKIGNLTQIDIEVLGGLKTRKEAAEELGIKYDTYQKRLRRKVNKIKNEGE